ncbi:hypothetical protein LOTGIDRAFT_167561 [Lottia gigantea]|uniref:5'-deoxynucleotidase HDDC2 n=1 Tax=Lottia gigantea TaxID=225164 RepID=V3ZP06_LOTGI|nr:hypothetical protein LOTGIDRAFT_167561 [Lottia gigantea]ESO86057.1 hypothetical protein LOTGIDRAFT_167561 [Lottia gigantea]
MASNAANLVEFFSLVGQLKRVKRTGWVRNHITDPESVAGHMYRMAVMALFISPDTAVNRDRCIKMCLVHDMAECIVGDITPFDGITKEEKNKREETAIHYICGLIPEKIGQEILFLWQEYESGTTPEAIFVKDLDKYDMIQQAHEYEQIENKPNSLQEFFSTTQGQFKTEQVQSWVKSLQDIRSNAVSKSEDNTT